MNKKCENRSYVYVREIIHYINSDAPDREP